MFWVAAIAAVVLLLGVSSQRSGATRLNAGWLVALTTALLVLGAWRLGARGLLLAAPLAAWVVWTLLRAPQQGRSGRSRPTSGSMTREEAARVLDVAEGASAQEIAAAHKKLIKKLHPDQGGSAFLTQQVNDAKRVLLRR